MGLWKPLICSQVRQMSWVTFWQVASGKWLLVGQPVGPELMLVSVGTELNCRDPSQLVLENRLWVRVVHRMVCVENRLGENSKLVFPNIQITMYKNHLFKSRLNKNGSSEI